MPVNEEVLGDAPAFVSVVPNSLSSRFFPKPGPTFRKMSGRPRRVNSAHASATTDAIAEFMSSKFAGGQPVKLFSAGSSGWSLMHVVRTPEGQNYFVKSSRQQTLDMFGGEAAGLKAMRDTRTIGIPEVYHYGLLPNGLGSFLVMENMEFHHIVDYGELGTQLAKMHLAEPAAKEAKEGKFGFHMDNTLGGTPQPNNWTDDWVKFFGQYRLKHQLSLANDRDLSLLGAKLMARLPEFFEGLDIKPSILHGDLWSGNINAVRNGPVIFDPATYYGHHEAEFGMSWCAGLTATFWEKYHELIPKAPGFERRKQLYMLYHYLNHFNLFGGSYYGVCHSILRKLTDS